MLNGNFAENGRAIFMYKMEHLTFQNLSCQIHYWYRKGSGDKWVFFFHGAGVDHAMFETQFGLFDSSYHIIAWDARGHGLSKLEAKKTFLFSDMISDCQKLFQIYSVGRAILIGQSMGGNLSQEIAYQFPNLVDTMVLIDCAKNTGKLTFTEKLALKSARLLFACYPWNILIRQSAAASSNTASVRKYIAECFHKMDKRTFVEVMLNMAGSCLHEDVVYRFHCPVLLLCGVDDRLGNIRKAMKPWAKEDGNCTLHMIEHASHNANQDNSAQVNQFIVDFLGLNQTIFESKK